MAGLKPHIKGDTYEGIDFFLELSEIDGQIIEPPQPIDLTGALITAEFRYSHSQGKITNIFTIGNGILLIEPLLGHFSLLSNEIIDWDLGKYYFKIKVELPDGSVKTYVEDVLEIIEHVIYETDSDCCNYEILYCDCPYAIIPCNKFIVRKNYKNQSISFYICVAEGNWGDQSFLDLVNFDVTFQLFDTQDSLYLSKAAEWSAVTKKCTVVFDEWDLKDTGYYYCVLDIQHKTEDLGWQVPDKHKRIDLEIK